MASDGFDWDVIIRLATQGAKGSVEDLHKVGDAVDQLSRENKISEKSAEANTRAISRLGESASGAGTGVANLAKNTDSLRYANYDLARSLLTVSAGLAALGVGAATAFASQESAFTEVQRIVGGTSAELSDLRGELQALSTEIPRSFQDLSGIAALGAALDIPRESLTEFTETVAKFAAVTGVTEEAAASGFGRIAQFLDVPREKFEALGSAILKAGNISVATEEQVLKFTQALAPAADRIGFTAEQTVALGAAIASVGTINVEGAGSALTRLTNTIERALGEGGESLEKFALISGNTVGEFRTLWETDADVAFNSIVGGLSGVENLTLALDELGIRNERDRRVISSLAQNYSLFNTILGETTSAWREGTYMSDAYGLVLDDLNSKWSIFVNALTNAAAAVGSTLAPALSVLLGMTTDILVAFAEFASSDAGQMFIRIATGVGIAVAAWAGLRGAIALTTAGLLGFARVGTAIGGAGIISGLRAMSGAFTMVSGSSTVATGAVGRFRLAFLALGRATLILGILTAASELIFNFGGSMQWLAQVTKNTVAIIGNAFAQLGNFVADVAANTTFLGQSIPALQDWAKTVRAGADVLTDMSNSGAFTKGFSDWANSLETADDKLGDFTSTANDVNYQEYTDGSEDWAEGLDGIGDSAGAAAAEIRTLVDYSNDLQSVFSRAFDLRFAGGSTLDAITSTFITIREASEASARNIAKMKAEIQGLQSDLSIQQYFLGIAIEYGDFKRAEAIQANIAKLQADLADKSADLTNEQDANSKSLTGNSKASIANRAQMEALVKQYQEHIVALASSGLSQEELARRTEELRQQFIQQATQLGYSRAEIDKYAASFDDLRLIIAQVPRNITLSVNANPAIQALLEYEAALNKARANAGQGISMPAISNPTNGKEVRRAALEAQILALSAQMQIWIASGLGAAAYSVIPAIANLQANLKSGNYWTGGFTGNGGKYEPAGVVHKGEYVIPKKDVNQRTGLPNADALGRLQKGAPGRSGYAGGGYVAPVGGLGASQIASLGPMAYQQFGQLFDTYMRTYLDGRVIADSSSQQYARSTQVGGS